MQSEATHTTKFIAKRNLRWAMLAWGVLSVLAIIGFLMERFPYRQESNFIFVGLVVIAIVLIGNFMLLIRSSVLGISILRRNRNEDNDPAISRSASLGTILGIAGAIISIFLFLGW